MASIDTLSTSPAVVPPRAVSRVSWTDDLRAPVVLILAGLLLLQLLLALLPGLGSGQNMAPVASGAPLLEFTPERIRRVRIEGRDGAPGVTLERRDNGWVLTDPADTPAQAPKVRQLLDTLAALQRPLPIATTPEALARFRVADTGFERRLTLEDERGPVATLLAGESPGFRRLLARPAADSGVYDLRLSLADLSDRRADWLETGLLRGDPATIRRIAAADWTLIRADGGWRLADAAGTSAGVDQGRLDPERAESLARALAGLGYRDVLGSAESASARAAVESAPRLVLTVERADGARQVYSVGAAGTGETGEQFTLVRSDLPQVFRLSSFDLEGVLDADPRRPPAPAPQTETQTQTDIQPTTDTASGAGEPARP